MTADKIRAMDVAEIENKVKESAEQMFRIKFQMGMGQTGGLKKLKELKKDRARMLTIIGEKNKGAK
ncbi:MAG: 50S ribosomal protein L29 [Bryobacteraceae bacterium]|nr:50S ribosomal protein L29 [Bryobacteraceae bacterium]